LGDLDGLNVALGLASQAEDAVAFTRRIRLLRRDGVAGNVDPFVDVHRAYLHADPVPVTKVVVHAADGPVDPQFLRRIRRAPDTVARMIAGHLQLLLEISIYWHGGNGPRPSY